jgi:hypothetical protein
LSFIDNDEDNLIELIISTLRKVAFPNLDFALLVFLLAGSYFLLVVLKRNNKTERSLSCLWLDLSSSRGTTRGALPRKASNLDSLKDPSVKSISSSCYKTASPTITSANKEEIPFSFPSFFLFICRRRENLKLPVHSSFYKYRMIHTK